MNNDFPLPSLKDVQVLISGTYESVTAQGKRDFVDVIMVKNLEMIILHYPGVPNAIKKVLIRGRQKVWTEGWRCEDGKRSHRGEKFEDAALLVL